MSNLEYWIEGVASSLDEHGVTATADQIAAIADDMMGGASVEGEYSHQPRGQAESEADRLNKELRRERAKVTCRPCGGTGNISEPVGTSHWSNSQCDRCNGSGRHDP